MSKQYIQMVGKCGAFSSRASLVLLLLIIALLSGASMAFPDDSVQAAVQQMPLATVQLEPLAPVQVQLADPTPVSSSAVPVSVDKNLSWIPPEGLAAPPDYTGKIAYLTYDDGPSLHRMPIILNLLKAHGINATFFLVGGNIQKDTYQNIYRAFIEGNVIANHTNDHFGAGSSVEHFKNSVEYTSNLIAQITGKKPECFRFPGGSNSGYMKNVIKTAIPWLHENGYEYFDWDTSVGDGNNTCYYTAQELCDNAMKYATEKELIVLMHDPGLEKEPSHDIVGATPLIIRALYEKGYKFAVLTNHTKGRQYYALP